MIIEFTIKEYREFLKISQEEMAEKIGISQAAYSKIE
jgi:DNA-binding XRE family transcriptional regulator